MGLESLRDLMQAPNLVELICPKQISRSPRRLHLPRSRHRGLGQAMASRAWITMTSVPLRSNDRYGPWQTRRKPPQSLRRRPRLPLHALVPVMGVGGSERSHVRQKPKSGTR